MGPGQFCRSTRGWWPFSPVNKRPRPVDLQTGDRPGPARILEMRPPGSKRIGIVKRHSKGVTLGLLLAAAGAWTIGTSGIGQLRTPLLCETIKHQWPRGGLSRSCFFLSCGGKPSEDGSKLPASCLCACVCVDRSTRTPLLVPG